MSRLMFGQAGTARKLRESHLSHTCRIVPKVLPGVYNAVAAVETPCSVRLWNRKMGILFGAIVGSGGGEFGMDRINDAAISFPVGTVVTTNDRVEWIEGARAYTVGQTRRLDSFVLDITVAAIEVSS